jgi:hypothetical protein
MGSKTPATTTQQQNSTTTQNPWATATPLLNNLVGGYLGVNPAVTPAQSAAGQNLIQSASGIPNLTPQATQAVQNIFGSAGMLPTTWGQVSGNLSPIAGMSADPYKTPGFSDALSYLTNNITNTVKGQYAASGREPSGAGGEPGVMARGLMQGEAPIIQDQYNKNLSNIMSANQMLSNAGINTSQAMSGNMLAALQGAGLLPGVAMAPATAQMGAANAVYEQPLSNLNKVLTPAMGLGGMGGTTTGVGTATGTQTPANDPVSNTLGMITGGAGAIGSLAGSGGISSLLPLFAMSDRQIKTDIKDVGRTHDNQKIYSYRFKGSMTPQIGMMADEVERKTPEAVMTGPEGLKRVRYDMATRKAAKMGMMPAYE